MDSKYNRGGSGQVIVEVEERYQERKNGLFIDTTYDPMKHTQRCGKVLQEPIDMGMALVEQVPVGFPGYGPVRGKGDATEQDGHHAIYAIGGVLQYRWTKDIAPEVRVGDKIWFTPRVLFDEKNLLETISLAGRKKHIFRVPYDQIYCAVREYDISEFDGAVLFGTEHGMTEDVLKAQFEKKFKKDLPNLDRVETFKEKDKVILQEFQMIGGWCLLEPIMEEWDTIFRPTYYDQVDKDGNPIPRPKEQWLQMKVMPDMDKMRGRVKHYGTPMAGETCELQKNMVVAFRPIAKFLQDIEGTKYIVCRQNQILAEVE
jgi:co-chaperonin GroES (HSP10)